MASGRDLYVFPEPSAVSSASMKDEWGAVHNRG